MMIEAGHVSLNPAHVASAQIDTRHYVNGSTTDLRIVMADGRNYRIEHGHGVDVYRIKKSIEDAK